MDILGPLTRQVTDDIDATTQVFYLGGMVIVVYGIIGFFNLLMKYIDTEK